jgi:hypothetical protein
VRSCPARGGQPKQWSRAIFLPAHERSESALASLIHEHPSNGVLGRSLHPAGKLRTSNWQS